MRLKTFIATYLLLLFILFSSVGIVSTYLTNSQINMLEDKSIGQFQVIVHTLVRDISVSRGRDAWGLGGFSEMVYRIVDDYARYYSRQGVQLSIVDLEQAGQNRDVSSTITFGASEGSYYIRISGLIPEPFGDFLLDYRLDITESVTEMRSIQRVLLISVIVFSIIAAFALNFILITIFKPLDIVAKASREIADGKFDERIIVKANNELAQVAYDFNKMAQTVESQISYLEDEAKNKQQFVDNFAHEIRTPLTSIHGYAEYMNKASLSEAEVIESTAYIMSEAVHMKNIANSLLELATLRDYVPIKGEIQVVKLFGDIAGTLESSLHSRGIELTYHSEVDIINAQEDLIRSLLLNLCTNALKACAPGEGVVRLEARDGTEGVVISVTDNGEGIPKASLDKVTEPFYRLDRSRNREYGGTGIGLALCNQIAAAHGAKMVIESELGIGTTVEVIFTISE